MGSLIHAKSPASSAQSKTPTWAVTKTVRKNAISHDVARLAGVSRSAVSRAFTPNAYISDETLQRVLKAAATLNYQPNAIARSLSKKSSRLIGIITTDLENPYYAQLLAHMSSELQLAGYAVLLMVARSNNIDDFLGKLESYQVDGVVVTAATLSSSMALALQTSGLPVVLVNNYLSDGLVSSVSSDNYAGGRVVADLLLQSGSRRIAFISGEANTSSGRDRELGLRDRLAEQGMTIYARESGEYRHAEAAQAARTLLSLTPRPDAIFCANDVMAIAALIVARTEFGICVPADLSIVGFDNTDGANWQLYQLTTVDQHIEVMAKKTVELLLSRLGADGPGIEHVITPVTLVERATHQTHLSPTDENLGL